MAWKKDDKINLVEEKIEKSFGLKSMKNRQNDATKDLKLYNFSFPIEYKEILTDYFKDQGKGFSTGVREILIQYMKDKNIL